MYKKPAENIVESGMVIKARKLSRKKRFLIVTDYPRIFYVDPKKMEFKVCDFTLLVLSLRARYHGVKKRRN